MIRKALPTDASRLTEILIFAKRTAYRPIFQADNVSFNEMQILDLALHYRDDVGALEDVYVYDDGIVRGMIHISRKSETVWELNELYVDPFFQRQGIGKHLVNAFLSMAIDHKVSNTYLWVLEKNAVARIFYESFGYQWDGTKALQSGTKEYILKYTLTCCEF